MERTSHLASSDFPLLSWLSSRPLAQVDRLLKESDSVCFSGFAQRSRFFGEPPA